jgi:RNA polymerase sigma-70 factor, ECF subfamily
LRGASVDTVVSVASPGLPHWAEELAEEHNQLATGGATAGLSVGLGADLAAALGAAQSGDEAGFVRLYRDVQPRLLRYATVLVGRDSAEDVTAEAWLQISRDLHRFSGDIDRFRGWAATIVHHRAMDLCRANARRPPVAAVPDDNGDSAEPADTGDTAVCALDALSTDTALGLIAALPREQAQAVLLRAVVGLDASTAGAVLGKRAGTVRVAAHRGLKKLARQVRYHPEEGRWTLV